MQSRERADFTARVEAFKQDVEAKAVNAKALLAEAVNAYKLNNSFPEINLVYPPFPRSTTRSDQITQEAALFIGTDYLKTGKMAHIMLREDATLRRYFDWRHIPRDKYGERRKHNYVGNRFEELSAMDYVIWVPRAVNIIIPLI